MISGFQVFNSHDISGPSDRVWILRTGDDESTVWFVSCGRTQQLFQLWLAIRRVSTHIAHLAGEVRMHALIVIDLSVHGTVQCCRVASSKPGFQLAKRRTACKAEVDVESRNV